MSSFEDRKKSFENKFARDEEVRFKIFAKRNKLLGEWAAAKLNIDDKQKYIEEVSRLMLIPLNLFNKNFKMKKVK